MKIIHRGAVPSERLYRSTCTRCKTVFEYQQSEATVVYHHRAGDYLQIKCPVCDTDVHQDVNQYLNQSERSTGKW